MFTTLIVFQVLLAVGLIAIVLVQRGPGATMGAAFGAGASGTVFGSRGAGNFLTRTTGWLAVGFFGISLSLAVLATSLNAGGDAESALSGSVLEDPAVEQQADREPSAGTDIDSALDELDRQAAPAVGDGADEASRAAGDEPAEPTDQGRAGDRETGEQDAPPEPPSDD